MDGTDATKEIQAIEDRFKFLTQLLHIKYRKRGKKNSSPFSSKNGLDDLSSCDRRFVDGILDIINKHSMRCPLGIYSLSPADHPVAETHFQQLSSTPPPSAFTRDGLKEPTGRMLAQFILSFFQPDEIIG